MSENARVMGPYLDLLEEISRCGSVKGDRTGTGTLSVFGRQMRFDLSKGFPAVTTKRLWMKGVVHELLWMLSGSTNIQYLLDNGVHIWDEWADAEGNLGPVYGKQWRSWSGHGEEIDQIKDLIGSLKTNPDSRRHIVTAWNPSEVSKMALPPCHCFFQFYIADNKLSCQLYQRSADMFLGVPFNIASYALLTHMVAQVVGVEVGDFIHTIGDAHIYSNHFEQVREQISRRPYRAPSLILNKDIKSLDDFRYEDIELSGYEHHPPIKAPVAV